MGQTVLVPPIERDASPPLTRARAPERRTGLALVVLAFVGFISLGLPDGLLGVGWPSIRRSFGLPLDALGPLLLTTAVGYLLASLGSGWVVGRLGVGRLLALSGGLTAVGLLGYALAPAWWALVALGMLAGLGAGAIDAGLNAYAALHHSPRFLTWLHASFGLGAAIGPIIMLAVLGEGHSWRWGYGLVGLLQAALGTCFLLTADRWRGAKAEAGAREGADERGPAAPPQASLRRPAVWLGVALFFIYTGIEAAAGQWSYSLFTEARGAAPELAARWVSVYWGGLAGGRVLAGVVANRVRLVWLVRLSMLGVLLGAVLVWWNPSLLLGLVGLGLMGLASAAIFPALIAATPGRLGPRHAANAIGFQVAAASLGIAGVPALVGVLAEQMGLEVIGPTLTVAAGLMLVVHEAVARAETG